MIFVMIWHIFMHLYGHYYFSLDGQSFETIKPGSNRKTRWGYFNENILFWLSNRVRIAEMTVYFLQEHLNPVWLVETRGPGWQSWWYEILVEIPSFDSSRWYYIAFPICEYPFYFCCCYYFNTVHKSMKNPF